MAVGGNLDKIDSVVKEREVFRERRNKLRNDAEKLTISELGEVTVTELVSLFRVMGVGMNPLDLPNTRDLEMVEKKIKNIIASKQERIAGK